MNPPWLYRRGILCTCYFDSDAERASAEAAAREVADAATPLEFVRRVSERSETALPFKPVAFDSTPPTKEFSPLAVDPAPMAVELSADAVLPTPIDVELANKALLAMPTASEGFRRR